MINAYLIVPASVLKLIMVDLAIGPVAAGWIISVMLGTQVIASIPVGIGLDHVNNRRAVLFGAVFFVLACLWSWQAGDAGNYYSLMASRVLGGVGLIIIWNAGTNHVGRLFRADRQATAIGVFTSSAPAGFAIGQSIGPVVATWLGWPMVFSTIGGICLIAAVVFWLLARRLELAEVDLETPGISDFRRVFTSPYVWHIGTLGFISFYLYIFVNSWMPTYLVEELNVSLTASGLFVATFAGIGVLSRGGSGALSDRLFDTRRRPVVLLSFGTALPFLAIIGVIRSVRVAFVTLLLLGFFLQLAQGLYYVYIRELVGRNVSATAISVMTSLSVSGAFLSPILTGYIIEQTGVYTAAFTFVVGLGVLGLLFAWRAPEPARM